MNKKSKEMLNSSHKKFEKKQKPVHYTPPLPKKLVPKWHDMKKEEIPVQTQCLIRHSSGGNDDFVFGFRPREEIVGMSTYFFTDRGKIKLSTVLYWVTQAELYETLSEEYKKEPLDTIVKVES